MVPAARDRGAQGVDEVAGGLGGRRLGVVQDPARSPGSEGGLGGAAVCGRPGAGCWAQGVEDQDTTCLGLPDGLPRKGQGWCQGGLSGAAVRPGSPKQVVSGICITHTRTRILRPSLP